MRKLIFIFPLILWMSHANAQQDSITTRDTIEFTYLLKNSIIPEFQELLNVIAIDGTLQNEVEQIIENRVKKPGEKRLFFDDKVIIDSDLIPGSDVNPGLRGEMTVEQYLLNFHTSYAKSEDPGISMTVLEISPLKKKDYLFYNVLFRCAYSGKTMKGETYRPFNRVAEIGLVKENRWRLYIRAIRFPLGNEMDISNSFNKIIKTETEVESVVNLIIDERAAKEKEIATQMEKLLFEGDNFFDDSFYEKALVKYREARLLDLNAKQPKDKIAIVKDKINELKDQTKKETERKLRIEELKSRVKLQYANYNFDKAKSLCDSLIQDYGIQDQEMDKLNDQLIEINASLAGIESAMEKRDWKNVIKQCEQKIKEVKDSISKAEYNYRLATVYFVSDIEEQKRIFEYSTHAIDFSNRQHQRALMLRAQMYLFTNQTANAIIDATRLINNDPRNPDSYIFRAGIYEKDRLFEKAIDDYGMAISLKTKEMSAYLKKSILEFELKKYTETQRTTTEGLLKFPCFGSLFFYRGWAQERMGDHNKAGNDFRAGKLCNISQSETAIIDSLSLNYVKTGDSKFSSNLFQLASDEYSKAIAIDSSRIGLYKRGLCYSYLKQDQKALADFNAIAAIDPKYKDVNYQRGLSLAKLDKCEDAVFAFNKELMNYAPTSEILLNKGKCEMKLKKYLNAGESFNKSAELIFSDSILYLASLAYYNAADLKTCIIMSQKARSQKSKMYEIYFLCGKAYYDQLNFDASIKEYEKALSLKLYDEDLIYAYASALQKKRNFNNASVEYDKLSESIKLRDTSLFLSAICLMKSGNPTNVTNACNKLNKYLIQANPQHKEIIYSWLAYGYLSLDSPAQANDQIEKSISVDPENPILNFSLACRASKSGAFDESCRFLDKALKSGQFSKEDVIEEKMLKGMGKIPGYKLLLAQYFPNK